MSTLLSPQVTSTRLSPWLWPPSESFHGGRSALSHACGPTPLVPTIPDRPPAPEYIFMLSPYVVPTDLNLLPKLFSQSNMVFLSDNILLTQAEIFYVCRHSFTLFKNL